MSKAYLVFSRVVLVKEKGAMYDIKKKVQVPEDAYRAITEVTGIQEEAQEVCGILVLDIKNRITAVHEVSRGGLNSASVSPREVFQAALLYQAAGIIFFHNHPSGDPSPSQDDIRLTRRIAEAGKILGIPLIDHIIVGDECHVSLEARGYLAA